MRTMQKAVQTDFLDLERVGFGFGYGKSKAGCLWTLDYHCLKFKLVE